jgi:hypothetical protein
MSIIIAIISILFITGIVGLFNRILRFKICPVCAGVSGTWLWMLIGMSLGQLPITNYQLPVSILMGGSVVGIAYQIEKRLPSNRSPLLWKILFVPAGFAAVYSAVNFRWPVFGALVIYLGIIAYWFWRPSQKHQGESRKTRELEEKMKKCC